MAKQQLLDGTIVDVPDYRVTSLATQGSALVAPRTPSPYLSSEKGLEAKQEADKTIARLTPAPTPGQTDEQRKATEQKQADAIKQVGTAFADKQGETTKQPTGYTLEEMLQLAPKNDAGQTDATGWQRQADGTYIPDSSALSRIGVVGTEPAAQTQGDKDLEKAKADREAAVAKLTNFNVSNDPALQSLIQGITGSWDARIREMEQINKSRVAAIGQTGIRMGSRYTGGAGGTFGSIISAEEQAAVGRIAGLESQKQAAIADAKSAYEDKAWNRYAKLADLAQNTYKEQLDAIKELNKAQAEKDKEVQGAKNLTAISTLMAEGITNPNTIISTLSKLGYKIDAKTLKDSMDSLLVENPQLKAIGDLRTTAVNNGAPQDVINAIINATDLGTAYTAAGVYGRGGTGIVGEYNRAVAGGYTGSFDDYQTADANRRRQIINLNAGGLTSQENQTFLTVTNKYQADSVINAAVKAGQISALADQIIADPKNATNQLASLYLFVKNLDPDSAVREGELALANQTQSYLQRFQNNLTRLEKGQVLAPAAAKELALATKKLVKTWEDTAKKKTKLYQSQANNSSPNVGNAFSKYIKDSELYPSTEETVVQDEQTANASLSSYRSSNPDKTGEMDSRIQVMETELGRPITSVEFLQAFPEYQQ